MKKQYFIFLAIVGMSAIMNVKAQNTPIDDFLKKYPSREGVTHVSMSQKMLNDIFTAPQPNEPNANSFSYFYRGNYNVPETYNSVTVSKDVSMQMVNDLKKTLLSSKYEQYMEVNRDNSNILGYYLKKVKDNTNEIIVLRQQKDQFSAIYIKGEIDINMIDRYLDRIKNALSKMGADNHTYSLPYDHQFAFSMPSFDDLKFPNFQGFNFKDFKFDSETFKKRMEESQQKMEESMKKLNDKIQREEFHRNIQDAYKNARRQMDESLPEMEEE